MRQAERPSPAGRTLRNRTCGQVIGGAEASDGGEAPHSTIGRRNGGPARRQQMPAASLRRPLQSRVPIPPTRDDDGLLDTADTL